MLTMGTNLGANWTEVTGDSELVLGTVRIPAGGIIVAVPTADRGAMQVSVTMMDLQPNKKYRVLINYDSDTGAYHYAEYDCTNTAVGGYGDYRSYLRVGSSAGGDAYEIEDTYTKGNDNALIACRTPGGLYATSENSEIVAWTCETEPTPVEAGLMNNSASLDIEFDDFSILRYEGTDSPLFPADPDTVHRCYYCACECDGECLPETLELTITASGGYGVNLSYCTDGYRVTLNYQEGNDPFEWYGSATLPSPTCTGGSSTVQFYFTCLGDQDFDLYTDWGFTGGATGWTGCSYPGLATCLTAQPYSIQCDPLEIVYGPFVESITPPGCDGEGEPACDGEIWITITE
jgi:hypothetical protein